MALTSVNYTRPKLAGTTPVAYQGNFNKYEDTANGLVILDEYATINAAFRLIQRDVKSYSFVGQQKTTISNTYTYESAAASTYDPTSLTTATMAPFMITQGTLRNTFIGYPVDLDVISTNAGTARS